MMITRMRQGLLPIRLPLPLRLPFFLPTQSINLGSTDVGDVSWQVPTGLIGVTTEAAGCALHTWQIVAQEKPSGPQGHALRARILFAAAKKLYESPERCALIQDDYQHVIGHRTYQSMLPDSVKPGDF